MYRQMIIILILNLIAINLSLADQFPNSEPPNNPCPEIFQYKYNVDEDVWYGKVTVPSPLIQHQVVLLKITLSIRSSTPIGVSEFKLQFPIHLNKIPKKPVDDIDLSTELKVISIHCTSMHLSSC